MNCKQFQNHCIALVAIGEAGGLDHLKGFGYSSIIPESSSC